MKIKISLRRFAKLTTRVSKRLYPDATDYTSAWIVAERLFLEIKKILRIDRSAIPHVFSSTISCMVSVMKISLFGFSYVKNKICTVRI